MGSKIKHLTRIVFRKEEKFNAVRDSLRKYNLFSTGELCWYEDVKLLMKILIEEYAKSHVKSFLKELNLINEKKRNNCVWITLIM